MKRILALYMGLCLLSTAVFAGENKRGEAGFMFLKVPIGAREASLGWTGLTTTSGAGALYWNPANVSATDRPSVTFSNVNYFAGISSNYFGAVMPVGDIGSFGIAINYLSYGNIPITTETEPNGTGASFSPYDLAFSGTYSKQITDKVSGGVTLKFLSSKIDRVSAEGYAFDFGFMYNTDFRGLKLGFAITNIGPQARYDGPGLLRRIEIPSDLDPSADNEIVYFKYGSEPFELPASVNFGLSMDVFRDEQNSVVGILDRNVNSYQVDRTNLALEYGFRQMAFARLGYTSALSKDKDFRTGSNSTAGLTFGGGLNYKFSDRFGMSVDYGYVDMGALDVVHRFTVGLQF
jgi:hypothetical protein